MKAVFVDNVLLERTPAGFGLELQPHLGLISLIATVRTLGHTAELYDPKVQLVRGSLRLGAGLAAAAVEQILARAPDVVGFTSLGCNFICTLKMAQALRRAAPHIPILLGGPHASIVDREILGRYDAFDVIVRGEAESTVGRVFAALGGGALGAIDGLTFRRGGAVVRTPDAGPILDLDALPMSAYDAFPIAELDIKTLDVDAGRGCPFSCAFCSTASFFGRRYRVKSARRLVDELDSLAERYGVRSFNLTHDLFTVNKQSVREFCRAVAGSGHRWRCSARMDCVDDALLNEMAEAGCSAIYFGVESGSQRLQRVVDKRLDLALYHPTIRSSLACKMETTVSFIIGFPGETEHDRDATLALMGESVERYPSQLGLQLHLLAPEPGTALHNAHAGSLAFDGHVGDFNFPLLEPGDADLIVADAAVFACHHYYADGGNRADDIAVAEAFHVLAGLGHVFLGALIRRSGVRFADLVRDFAAFRRPDDDDDGALLDFMRARWGVADAYYDIVRYLVAARRLADDSQPAGTPSHSAARIRLTRRAVPMAACRNGQELYRRLRGGGNLDDDGLSRSPHLLIAAPGNPASRTMFAIDEVTLDVSTALQTPTSRDGISAAFAGRDVERRLWALELMGAIVSDDGCAPLPARKISASGYALAAV